MDDEQLKKYQAPAAGAAIDVLLALARARTPLSIGQLVNQTGRTRSLVYRVLCELMARDSVTEVENRTGLAPGSTLYELGPAVVELGGSYVQSVPFMQSVRSALRRLADRTGETASLAILQGDRALYLLREEGERSVLSVSQVGRPLPAHATAVGKAMMAELSDHEIRALYGKPGRHWQKLTSQTIGDLETLLSDIVLIRRRGYSLEVGETVAGRACVAISVPVADTSIERVGISISTDQERLLETRENWVDMLMEVKETLTTELTNRATLGDTAHSSPTVLLGELGGGYIQ